MHREAIARAVLDAAFQVHTTLGPGLLESAYEAILAYELAKNSIRVQRQVPIAIAYQGLRFDEGFRADLLVADEVIVELKSVEALAPVHAKQVLTYLRITGKPLGLLINFGEVHLRNGIKRLVHRLPEIPSRPLRP